MASIDTFKQDMSEILLALDPRLVYHSWAHTFEWVYPYAVELARHERLSEQEIYHVSVASLIHDAGFKKRYTNNEPIAVEMLRDYAKTHRLDIPHTQFEMICDAILNTNMQSPPTTIYAQILRDADLSALGHIDFLRINALLREEARSYPGTFLHSFAMEDARWKKLQLEFMDLHRWFTPSAYRLFEAQKRRNIALVKQWRD